VRLIRLDDGDRVVSLAKLVDGGDDDLLEDVELDSAELDGDAAGDEHDDDESPADDS
jgi:hypothetical protein